MARTTGEKVGDQRKRHPYPLRLRSPYIPREQGGAEGWRGKGWPRASKEAQAKARGRSSVSGFDKAQGHGLQVDHINPFRLGGKNRATNLRVTDYVSNPHVDNMTGAKERTPKRGRW